MFILELIILAFVFLAGMSIVWTTLRTGISPMLSSGKARKAMLDALGSPKEVPLIDLGSGWGTLVIAMARKYPHHRVIGYELSWSPWLVSLIRKYFLRLHNLTLYRRDFLKAEFPDPSVLLCYLFPGGMRSLEQKLASKRPKDIRIISNTFALPPCSPAKTIRLNDAYRTPIYVYDQINL